jgi:uncharacterized protein VirK/YbjX
MTYSPPDLPAYPAFEGAEPALLPVRLRAVLALAGAIYPMSTASHALGRIKFQLRSLLMPRVMQSWLAHLSTPHLMPLLLRKPRLLEKPQQPYLCSYWDGSDRAQALHAHYGFLHARLPNGLLRKICLDGGVLLAELHEAGATLWLGCEEQFEKEGELTVSLRDAAGTRLVSATFTMQFTRRTGPAMLIGGVQGAADTDGRMLARDLTQHMHGLPPKELMLLVLQEIADCWKVRRLLGVADHAHVHEGPGEWLKTRRMQASYDALWAEAGGLYIGKGFYLLPLRSSGEEISPGKRALYQRRCALTDRIRCQLRAALSA